MITGDGLKRLEHVSLLTNIPHKYLTNTSVLVYLLRAEKRGKKGFFPWETEIAFETTWLMMTVALLYPLAQNSQRTPKNVG